MGRKRALGKAPLGAVEEKLGIRGVGRYLEIVFVVAGSFFRGSENYPGRMLSLHNIYIARPSTMKKICQAN